MTLANTVMIVDDSQTIRQVVRGYLEDDGYEVVEASDGETAIDACEQDPPDVVLLDIEMPGLNGHQVLARLKANLRLRDIPVVFFTSKENDVLLGLAGGAHDYVTKGFTPAELRARVRSAMRVKTLQDELTRRGDELDRSSRTDVLTGLFNRRHLVEQLTTHLLTARRHGQPVGVLLLDIDHFKRVNDTYGHLAGDEVLIEFSRRIELQLRGGDVAGRWGGEEFLVILPQTGMSGTFEVGEKIRVSIASQPFITSAAVISITVSGGSAVGPGASGEDLVQRADTGLYEAKDGGRNRIVPTMAPQPLELGPGSAPGGASA